MRMSQLRAVFGALLCVGSGVYAEEIRVIPQDGALAAALARAKSGDVVKVAAGEYRESVVVGEGVTIEGEGAAVTILVAPDYAGINCQGAHVRIVGLTLRGGEKNVRGVNASGPVRVERCRFEKVKEAVALMEAPMSDVVACEFQECGIGVRAIGGASPTVWGCVFKGGNLGVFSMDGAPYIRNNLFESVQQGVRMFPRSTQSGIVRNNVFKACEKAAIEVGGEDAILWPSIRNNVFVECGGAVVAGGTLSKGVSHSLVSGTTAPAFRDGGGKETVKVGESSVTEGSSPVTIGAGHLIQIVDAKAVEGRGIRLCHEAVEATGTIGVEKEWLQLGTAATAKLPPVRSGRDGKGLIANSVKEEHQYLKVLGRRFTKQSLSTRDGVRVDRFEMDDGKEPSEIVFDISRFFGEEGVK